MNKHAARMALALSNSVPGALLKSENIEQIDDISKSLFEIWLSTFHH
jgi:hypothetical protein